jgi:hypothetical protein
MTWGKATPVLAVAVIFDLIRCFFEWFVFFGPALGAVVCTAGINSVVGTTIAATGGKVVATVCTAAGVAGGIALSETTETIGEIMSIAIGFAGFLTLGLWIIIANPRIFKVNVSGSWWFIGGFGISEIPFVGSIPAFSIVLYKLYRTQIKIEKANLKKWESEQENNRLQERNQRVAELMQEQQAQLEPAEI